MKCDQCEKPATYHITELMGDTPQEVHLCEEHAHHYLATEESGSHEEAPSLAGTLSQQLKLGQTAEDLARLDKQECPVCGITFYEFRNQGRLGCPHDYVCFEEELEPLVFNIHGATEHQGKRPKHAAEGSSDWQTDLIRLRRELKEAIAYREYERGLALMDSAEATQNNRFYEEAISVFDQVRQEYPGTESEIGALSNKGVCLEGLNRWREAVEVYDEVIKLFEAKQATKDAYQFAKAHRDWIVSSRL